MIPILIYAQLADLITALFAVSALGITEEWNPVAVSFYGQGGLLGLTGFKLAPLPILVFFSIRWQGRPPSYLLAGFGILAGTIGALVNVAALAVSV